MLEWVYRTAERVDALARTDPEYQELAKRRLYLEDAYTALLEQLNEEDRELLLEYMDIRKRRHGKLLLRPAVISSVKILIIK